MPDDTGTPNLQPASTGPKVGMHEPVVVAAEPVQRPQVISSPVAGAKSTGGKVKVGSTINLLTDTEKVVKIQKIQGTVFKVSSLVVFICLVIGAASYGAWWWQNSRLTRIQQQVERAERDLEGLKEVYQYALAYDDRLKNIKEVWSGNSTLTPRLLHDLSSVAASTEGVLASVAYDKKNFTASYTLDKLANLHLLIELLDKKENDEALWSPITIERVGFRQSQYEITYESGITKKYEEGK